MQITFCLHEKDYPTPDWVKAWEEGNIVSLQEPHKCVTTRSWTYQTWSLLKQAGIPCELSSEVPKEGIVILLSTALGDSYQASRSTNKNLFLVDIVAHYHPHPAAQLHLLQNQAHARWLPNSLFIPHWAHPHLIPRNPERGTRFETVCFFGDIVQLTQELDSKEWSQRLKEELQLNFELREASSWHDYSDIDCVLAVRDFSKLLHFNKPATKLYNAWHAGVPFIGGEESAYATDGHPGKDYLVAGSLEEAFQHLKRLKEDPILRTRLVQNGLQSGKKFTREATLECWREVVEKTLPALATEWQKKSDLGRQLRVTKQKFFCFLDRHWPFGSYSSCYYSFPLKSFFCLPQEHLPHPEWAARLLSGQSVATKTTGYSSNQNWIFQTWVLLLASHTRCYAMTELPVEGILITLCSALPRCKPPKTVFLVDVVADGFPHPAAHLYLVQNSAQAKWLPNSIFMPHWPQPGLIPRDLHRGTRFENICYFGDLENLTPELQSEEWQERLEKELGLRLYFPGPHQWHDYSQTDCVLAIRNFSKSRHFHKPGTKLYNAWHAAVPFIGGRDSAYAADGRPGIDYLVATSPEEVFQHLKRLKEDPSFRASLVNNGFVSRKKFTRESTLERWRELVEKKLPLLAAQWQKKSAFRRHLFFIKQTVSCFLNRYWSSLII